MYKKLVSNTGAQILSKLVTALISLVLIAILTSTLSVELFGAYNKIYNYFVIFAFLADLGLYTLMIREVSSQKVSAQKVLANSLALRIAGGICVCIFALGLAFFIPGFGASSLIVPMICIALFTLLSLINSCFLALMQSHMRMEYHFISFVGGKLLHLALIAFFGLYYFTESSQQEMYFISLFFAGLLSVLSMTYLNYRYVASFMKVRLEWDHQYIKNIFLTALPYGIALFLSVVYFRIDIVFLGMLEGRQQGDISIALYSLPMKIVEVLMVLGAFYMNSLLPKLTELYQKNDSQALQNLYKLSVKILLSFGVFIYSMANIFALDVMKILGSESYIYPDAHSYSSLDVFPVVFAVLGVHFLALLHIYLLIASHRQSILLKINIFVMMLNILGNILFIPSHSFMAAAYTTLLTQALLMGIVFFILRKECVWDRKLSLQLLLSSCFAGAIYIGGNLLVTQFSLGSYGNIFIYGCMCLLVYIACEYIVAKKYLISLS